MTRRATPLRPAGAPRLGETYRDWRDFTNRVARPWVENDGDDARVDNWYSTLMMERDPWYIACALVMADNRIRELEGSGDGLSHGAVTSDPSQPDPETIGPDSSESNVGLPG